MWVLAALGVLLFPDPTPGQTPGAQEGSVLTLSLEEALLRAERGNPSLRMSRNEEASARWDLRAARGALFPSLSSGFGLSWEGAGQQRFGGLTAGDLGITQTPSYYFSSYTLGFSLGISGASVLEPRRAEASLEATRAWIGSSEAALRLDVSRAYLDVLRSDEGVRLARSELSRAEANLNLAAARTAVGAATTLEERQAEVAVGRARVNLVREEGEARNSRIRLFQLMGEEPRGRDLRLTSSFSLDPVTLGEDELYARSLEMNPELAALEAQEEAASLGLSSARSSYLPSLNIQGGWSGFTRRTSSDQFLLDQARRGAESQIAQCQFQNEIFSRLTDPLPPLDCGAFEFGPGDRDAVLASNRAFPFDFTRQPPSVSLALSFPIFQGFQRQRQVEAARVARSNARLQVEERRLALRSEIARGLVTLRTAYQAAQLEEANVAVAEEQLVLAREQFREGMVDFLQLADAEAVKARADREYLAAVFAYHEARATLAAVVGIPFREP
jgi:outer membrane protein